MHAFRVFPADDVQQFVQFRTDTFHLCRRAGIEQDFLQEEIVFAQHALGDGHVALEGGTRSILVFHDGRKHEGRYERDGQGVGHGFVVFVERVFKDVQLQTLVEVFEENLAQMVAFLQTLFGEFILKNQVLKSTAISDAGITKQTLYEVEKNAMTRSTYDRAMDSLDAVNGEIATLVHEAWGR